MYQTLALRMPQVHPATLDSIRQERSIYPAGSSTAVLKAPRMRAVLGRVAMAMAISMPILSRDSTIGPMVFHTLTTLASIMGWGFVLLLRLARQWSSIPALPIPISPISNLAHTMTAPE